MFDAIKPGWMHVLPYGLAAVAALASQACSSDEARGTPGDCVTESLEVELDDKAWNGRTVREVLASYTKTYRAPLHWLRDVPEVQPELHQMDVVAVDELTVTIAPADGRAMSLLRIGSVPGKWCGETTLLAWIDANLTTRDTGYTQAVRAPLRVIPLAATFDFGWDGSAAQLRGGLSLQDVNGETRLAGAVVPGDGAGPGATAKVSVPCGGLLELELDDASFGPSGESLLSAFNRLDPISVYANGVALGHARFTLSPKRQVVCVQGFRSRQLLVDFEASAGASRLTGSGVLRMHEPENPLPNSIISRTLTLPVPSEAAIAELFPSADPALFVGAKGLTVQFDYETLDAIAAVNPSYLLR